MEQSGAVSAIALGLLVAMLLAKGAFYAPACVLLPGVALVAAGWAAWSVRRLPPAGLLVGWGLLLAWWLVAAAGWGVVGRALPFAGSVVALVAGAVLGVALAPRDRAWLVRAVWLLAAATAAVGLVGVALRWYPMAMPAQDLWRVSGPLTYSNAEGALLAMAGAWQASRRPTRSAELVAALTFAGLGATLSRGAALAGLVALLVLRSRARTLLRPVLCALPVWVAAAAVAHGPQRHPELLVVVLLCLALAASPVPTRWLAAGAAALAVVVLVVSGSTVATTVSRRAGHGGVDDRTAEWSAAADRWRAHPWVGAGPERPLVLTDGRVARFVHDEPLEVLADAGAVGGVLLAGALLSPCLGRRRRGRSADPRGGRRAAGAAVAALAVAGTLDFVWHVPALTLVAGLACGVAGAGEEAVDE